MEKRNLEKLTELGGESLQQVSGGSGSSDYELNPPALLDVTRAPMHVAVDYNTGSDILDYGM